MLLGVPIPVRVPQQDVHAVHVGGPPQAVVRAERGPERRGGRPLGRVQARLRRLRRAAGPVPGHGRLALRLPLRVRRLRLRRVHRRRPRRRPQVVLHPQLPQRHHAAVAGLPGLETVQR